MTEEEVYAELPDDPELAFLKLEDSFRKRCDEELQERGEHDSANICYVAYISKVLAAIEELSLKTAFSGKSVPTIETVDFNTYINFRKDVEHFITTLRIRHGRRIKQYSVRFNPATKAKIQHHLQQIRGIVEKLEITEPKRNALFSKIDALSNEVSRNRTRFEAYADLVIESAEVLGEAADKAEPARKWLDSIAKLFWGAKDKEQIEALPAPATRKALEPPRGQTGPQNPGKSGDLDDEIPF